MACINCITSKSSYDTSPTLAIKIRYSEQDKDELFDTKILREPLGPNTNTKVRFSSKYCTLDSSIQVQDIYQ